MQDRVAVTGQVIRSELIAQHEQDIADDRHARQAHALFRCRIERAGGSPVNEKNCYVSPSETEAGLASADRSSLKTIRSLERGLAIWRLLQFAPALTLAELHARSGLAKATLLRILRTLEREGLVWRTLGEEAYSSAPAGTDRRTEAFFNAGERALAQVAVRHLVALQRKVLWPSDLVVRHGHYMRLVETNRSLSHLHLTRDPLGERIDLAASAVGRAYLAFCPAAVRRRLIEYLAAHPGSRGKLGPLDRPALENALDLTRERGYAVRDLRAPNPVWRLGHADDHLDAMAVPILDGARIYGCINLLWLRRLRIREQMIKAHLGDLREAAAAISVDMAAKRKRQAAG